MKEKLPSPEFDSKNYARPNQNWICGRACEGSACRLGPDTNGKCGAGPQCKPVLETKPGESKGRWKCTRPGGECTQGPLPDGSCCTQMPKCSPTPTLRLWRGRLTMATVAACCSFLLLTLAIHPIRNRLFNPGRISQPHSTPAFAMAAQTNHLGTRCGSCHAPGNAGAKGLVNAALMSSPGPFDFTGFTAHSSTAPVAMDSTCQKCHTVHNFHHATAQPASCIFCHQEHQGQKMAAVPESSCAFCHGNADTMTAASKAGGRALELSSSFPDQHPQFRFITSKQSDPDTLRFNHALHLTSPTIPKLPGNQPLDCAFCHRKDGTGTLMRPVNFEQNCRVCHSLQFDPETPELSLPHGNVSHVSAFLRSLPKQYADLAAKEHVRDRDAFVQAKLLALRELASNGEDLEHRIFFTRSSLGPDIRVGTVAGASRAVFNGCAYCHAVGQNQAGLPEITKPFFTERWINGGSFSHESHVRISCEKCHNATRSSKETADILIPGKESCAECHSPQGGSKNSCSLCHVFHVKPDPTKATASSVLDSHSEPSGTGKRGF